MLVKQRGGMTEFIPTPSEKRDGVIRNHVLELLANLDARIRQLEQLSGIPSDMADEFRTLMSRIEREETHVQRLNDELVTAGISLLDSSIPRSAGSR